MEQLRLKPECPGLVFFPLYALIRRTWGDWLTHCFWKGDPCGIHFCPICTQGKIMKTKIKKKKTTLLFVLKIVESG